VSELEVPRGGTSAQQPRQRPLDWQLFLRRLAACTNLRELALRYPHISRAAALELTALTQLERLTIHGVDEYVQERLTACLGSRCNLSFPPA
jgi:hypothetical protein